MPSRVARFLSSTLLAANAATFVAALFGAGFALALTPCVSGARAQEGGPAPASAPGAISPEDEEKARAHFRLGRAHYDNGNFAQAAVEFEEAYRISQRAALLYNIYLAYRDANDTRNAATSLRKYLELQADVENRGQLEARLAALERSIADGTAPQPAVAAPAATPAPEATPAADATPAAEAAPAAATQATPETTDEGPGIVPWVLIGTGGAMAIGGTVFWAMSSGKASELDKLCPDQQKCMVPSSGDPEAFKKKVNDLKSSGSSLATIGDVLFFGGIAVGGTGAALLILHMINSGGSSESDTTSSAPTASVTCAPGLCGGSVAFRF